MDLFQDSRFKNIYSKTRPIIHLRERDFSWMVGFYKAFYNHKKQLPLYKDNLNRQLNSEPFLFSLPQRGPGTGSTGKFHKDLSVREGVSPPAHVKGRIIKLQEEMKRSTSPPSSRCYLWTGNDGTRPNVRRPSRALIYPLEFVTISTPVTWPAYPLAH